MALDFRYLFQFYIALLVLGIVVMPLSVKLFNGFKDKGFILSKVLGLYLCGYLMWLLSSCHILKFRVWTCVLCVLLVAIANYGYAIWRHKKGDKYLVDAIIESKIEIIVAEVVFLLLFAFINWVFAHRVQSFATERLMDYGFMVSISKADYMPPKDMWAAGNSVNYYYFGQYIFVFIQKLCGVTIGHAYTFGLFGIMTWMLMAIYRIVEAVSGSRIAGVISAIVTTVGGNLHYIVYKYIVRMLWEMLGSEGDAPHYWFADSTRYIGYNPVVEADRTIHEFPMYSFIIGDLHAHVTNIMAVLLMVALLWSWLCIKKNLEGKKDITVVIAPQLITIGFLLAISNMANYWDFPIYYVVSGSIILFGLIKVYGMSKKTFIYVAFIGIMILALSVILSVPFNINFVKMVEGIGIVTVHTKLYQLIILWGLPIGLVALFIVMLIREKILLNRHLFVMLLGLCATGLVLIPEFVFVKDIYINGFPRANTMFKLTFQAFILFGICSGCIVVEFCRASRAQKEAYRKHIYTRRAVLSVLLLVLAVGYCPVALKQWFKDGKNNTYISMNAAYNIEQELSPQMDAIRRLQQIVKESGEQQPVVLTTDGESYTKSCAISAITGYPTVLGWHTHEWLWHNSREFYEERKTDVEQIYTGSDAQYTKELLDKYDISYIYIGPDEYESFDEIQSGVLESFGETVYSCICETGQLIEIIKVDR